MKFKEGDKIYEVGSNGERLSETVWTFWQYNELGRVMLKEFTGNPNNSFSSKMFRKATKLEKILK